MQASHWSVAFAGAPTLSPWITEMAQRHLGLGDAADQVDLDMIVQSAARLATEMTGRAVGEHEIAFRAHLRNSSAPSVTLPYAAEQCTVLSVALDGSTVPSAQYSTVRNAHFWTVRFTQPVTGQVLEVRYRIGSAALDDADQRLLLILCGDLYRARESAGDPGRGAITAQLLADMRRVYYLGPEIEA